jgi:nitroimidazol reductase NimA-like FMN-containing flavoprotein (pyridoxamine 5'-phosphate oxidase superfamily)
MSVYHPTVAVISGQEALDLMVGILNRYDVGHLALSGEDYPYVIPINHTYHEGKLILHGSIDGKKVDLMQRFPRVCYGVYGTQSPAIKDGEVLRSCAKDFQSVVCTGTIRVERANEEWRKHLAAFARDYSHKPPEHTEASNTYCYIIDLFEMTARVAFHPEPKVIYSYRFPGF